MQLFAHYTEKGRAYAGIARQQWFLAKYQSIKEAAEDLLSAALNAKWLTAFAKDKRFRAELSLLQREIMERAQVRKAVAELYMAGGDSAQSDLDSYRYAYNRMQLLGYEEVT